ncbi:GtrA family protein [Brucella lupini]|uniref:GtrA family protein n=1 Tax=Brucella lupini TaxID=255457 RepID=A0AB34DHR5_9HYPH|nr:GtrA family protein [Brucella lupini]
MNPINLHHYIYCLGVTRFINLGSIPLELSVQAVKFIIFSGLGWLCDFAIFGLLVSVAGMSAGSANFISATIAAMAVFIASKLFIFASRESLGRSTLYYLIYTEANILVWALIIQFITHQLVSLNVLNYSTSALFAKLIVTPFSLLCNFVTSRWLSNRRWA